MRKSHIRWLYSQLDDWVTKGVLSEDGVARLRDKYGPADKMSGRSVALTICSILGGILIGGGVLLVLGHNWSGLSRPIRTVLSLAPMVVGQAGLLWCRMSGRTSVAWREGVTAYLALTVGAAIALVGQTYHLPGDMAAFLLTWALLVLPLVYLVEASLPALFYMALILGWAGHVQSHAGHVLLFWPLAGLVGPHIWLVGKKAPYSNRSSALGWVACIALSIGAGISLEKSVPGLWVIIYASLFACMYLVGSYWSRHGESAWQRPWQGFGAVGIACLTMILTFEDVWRDVGWNYYHYGARYHRAAEWVDYVLALGLPCIATILLVMVVRRKQICRILYALLPILAVAGFCVCSVFDEEWPAMLAFNAYALVLGIGTIVMGIRESRVGPVNGGMLILATVIVLRFFDGDLGFLARGIVFIALGVGFLVTNLVLAKRWKKGGEHDG